MKIFFLRVGVMGILVFFQLSFLDILFPWFHTPLLLLASIVAWTLVSGFPRSLFLTVPLTLLFESLAFGWIGSFSLYAVLFAYATSFLSRRLSIDRRGAGLFLYAFFSAVGAMVYQLILFLLLRSRSNFSEGGISYLSPILSPEVLFFSFILNAFLFLGVYYFLKRFENYLELMSQRKYLNVR